MTIGLFALSVLLLPIELRLLWLGWTTVRRLSPVGGLVVSAGAGLGLLAGFLTAGGLVATTVGVARIFLTDEAFVGSRIGGVTEILLFLTAISPFGHGLAFAAAGLAIGLQVNRLQGTAEDARTTRESW